MEEGSEEDPKDEFQQDGGSVAPGVTCRKGEANFRRRAMRLEKAIAKKKEWLESSSRMEWTDNCLIEKRKTRLLHPHFLQVGLPVSPARVCVARTRPNSSRRR